MKLNGTEGRRTEKKTAGKRNACKRGGICSSFWAEKVAIFLSLWCAPRLVQLHKEEALCSVPIALQTGGKL